MSKDTEQSQTTVLIFWSTAAWSPGTLNTSFGQIIKLVKGAWEGLLGYHHSSAGRVLAGHAWSWVCSLEGRTNWTWWYTTEIPALERDSGPSSAAQWPCSRKSSSRTLNRVTQALYWPVGGMWWRAAYYLSSISALKERIRDYLTRSWLFWNSMLLAEVWISTVSL